MNNTIMKRINKFLVAVAIIMPLFTSCKDMMEEEIYGKATVDEILTSEENIPLLVGQAYADVKWIHDHWGYWGVSSLTADECLCPTRMPGTHWADGGYWRRLNNHMWDADADAFKNIWNTTISGAVLCNKLVDQLNGKMKEGVISEQVTAQYVSELEVLRSFYFYMLYECFGRIPYTEKYAIDNENGGKEKYASEMPLMEVPAVWSMLVTCLEKNVQAGSIHEVKGDADRAQYYGRMTAGAANAMLAHLYLNAESYGITPENLASTKIAMYNNKNRQYEDVICADYLATVGVKINSATDFYTKAVESCDRVIGKAYTIENDFFANFLIQNDNSKENIFVIVENGNDKFDYRDYAGSMANKLRVTMLTLHYQHKEVWNLIETPWNGFCARPQFLDIYKGNDEKWADLRGPGNEGNGTNNVKKWGWFIGPVYKPDGKNIAKDANDSLVIIRQGVKSLNEATWNDGARLLKYEVDKQALSKYCENDFVLYRYADILWIKEEAIKRGGVGISGISSPDFQRMLTRAFAYEDDPKAAFVAAYGDPESWSVDDFLNERGREFAWENQRRRDLIRFGKYGTIQYSESNEDYRKWFPIPSTVIQKSSLDENGKPYWTQNSGY